MGITEFLECCITNDSNKVTHTSMTGGKWYIPPKQYKPFYKLIRKAVANNEVIPPLTETMGEYHPLIFDFDMKYNQLITEKPYNLTFLKHLSEFLWICIGDVIDIDDENKYNDTYIMGKSKPYPCTKQGYKSKDGIHFLYPKIVLSREAYKVLCKTIQDKQNDLFEIYKQHSIVEPSNLNDTLFDGKFTRWMPYLCHKEGEEPYKLEHVFIMAQGNAEQKNPALVTGPNSIYTDERLMIEMSMFRDGLKENVSYTEYTENQLKSKALTNSSNMVNQNSNGVNEGVPNIEDVYASFYVDHNNVINPYKIVEEEELKLLTNLCECFSVERASEYGKWLDVGLALHNTNSDKFLPVWEKFSQKYSKYRDGSSKRNCSQKWKTFNTSKTSNPLTVGSLRYWANHDDRNKFNKVMIDNLGSQIEKSISHGHDAHHLIGLVIHKYYEDQFLCVDIGDDWYFFDGNKWKKTLKGHELKKRIHKDIYNIYHEYENKYKLKLNEEDDPDEKDKWQKKLSKCLTFMQKLLQENYVNTVIGALRHLFYKENVAEDFDSNLTILGVDNGVIDLKDWVFREGRPEDYITKTTGFSIPIGNAELPIHLSDINSHLSRCIKEYNTFKQDLNSFIKQIIPIDEVREYALRFLSKCLSGENRDEGFYIWTGSGGNGKSKLIELMQLVLGDYAGGLPVSLITKSRSSSNSATPEMERTKGMRLVVMQEPEANESINIGLMKELTGGDKIYARGLFKEPIEFIPQFKLLLMCNDLPTIPSNDDGTWRRLEVVDFISRFVDDESKLDDSKHVYKRDKQLKAKFEPWKLVFFGIILEEWMKYDKEGITVPKMVHNKTKSYKNENDIVGQWIDQMCEITDNIPQKNGLELAPGGFEDLFYSYKEWCQGQGYKVPDKKKTKDDLIKWQEKSTYGLSLGRYKKDGRANGTIMYPSFNLKVIQEE
jgi:P4 family phage/plasmid primase-like protien